MATPTNAPVNSDPSLESFVVTQGTAQAGARKGQTYVRVNMWAKGRQTLTVVYGDDKAHLLTVLARMSAAVSAFSAPKPVVAAAVAAAPVVAAAAAPDLAAIMAQIEALRAENARLAGQSAAPVVAAAPSATQTRLSRIGRGRAK